MILVKSQHKSSCLPVDIVLFFYLLVVGCLLSPKVDSFATGKTPSCTIQTLQRQWLTLHPQQQQRRQQQQQRQQPSTLFSSSQDSKEENDLERQQLLEKARKLREEAQSLEDEIRRGKSETILSSPTSIQRQPIVTDLKDSTWTITYRFSSQPQSDQEEDTMILPNYSGKVTLRLKMDGYSEIVSSSADDSSTVRISKIWGWDEEYSQEDQQQYLLFSIDVLLPASDPKLPNMKERYYFQSRIDRVATTGEILLKDGTITVKKDVSEKTRGMWGLFQVAGILSQFRYVGEFIAKPSL